MKQYLNKYSSSLYFSSPLESRDGTSSGEGIKVTVRNIEILEQEYLINIHIYIKSF